MAVKKSGVNKSQAIRNALATMPNAPASEVAAAATKECGEEVTTALVYNVKSTDGKTKKPAKKKAAPKQTAAPAASAAGGDGVDADLIKEAASFLNHAGDAAAARKALAFADEILKVLKK